MLIERLGPADVDAGLALAADRDWTPDRRRWPLLFEQGEAYGIRDPAGGLIGCVILVPQGRDLAAVGMMLVAARWERRGLGRRLMEHVLDRAGAATVVLYATALGRPLYERLGFRTVDVATTCIGAFTAPAPGATRAATAADRAAIRALDAAAIGADRAPLLDGLLESADQLRVLERDGTVTGFAAAAQSGTITRVGPLVAPDLDAARALMADIAVRAPGLVRLDLRDELVAWAHDHGAVPGDRSWLMVHGDRELPGDRARLIVPAMLATG